MATKADGAPSPPVTKPKTAATAESDVNRFEEVTTIDSASISLEPASASVAAKDVTALVSAIPEDDGGHRATFQLVHVFCHINYPNLKDKKIKKDEDAVKAWVLSPDTMVTDVKIPRQDFQGISTCEARFVNSPVQFTVPSPTPLLASMTYAGAWRPATSASLSP